MYSVFTVMADWDSVWECVSPLYVCVATCLYCMSSPARQFELSTMMHLLYIFDIMPKRSEISPLPDFQGSIFNVLNDVHRLLHSLSLTVRRWTALLIGVVYIKCNLFAHLRQWNRLDQRSPIQNQSSDVSVAVTWYTLETTHLELSRLIDYYQVLHLKTKSMMLQYDPTLQSNIKLQKRRFSKTYLFTLKTKLYSLLATP